MVQIVGPSLNCIGFTIATDVDAEKADLIRADAHLISASPDLLALAKMVHGSFGGGLTITFTEDDEKQFAAAIAKAEGQP
jgi:hypothetical protein